LSLRRLVVVLGPGLAIAATGVGAGDLMSALIAGARHGTALLWVIAVGAILKFVLNEGVARWQLATGKTVIEGWTDHLGRPVLVYFTAYLAIWGIIVAAGLMAACGVAAHALVPAIPIGIWSVLHSLVALGLVWLGRYEIFEGLMKVLILLMVLTILGSVVLLRPDWGQALASLATPKLPTGSAPSALSLMGGVGGSVTLLSYGYWIREKGWRGQERIGDARIDLGVGYLLTGIFGVAMLVVAATVLGPLEDLPPGSEGLIACADAIGDAAENRLGLGPALRFVFLIGVWGAMFTSLIGVWQGVPYLFAETLQQWTGRRHESVDPRGRLYRGGLILLALPPMILLALGRPVWLVQLYTAMSGLFMPLLAGTLLWLNRQSALVGQLRLGPAAALALALALLLFAAVLVRQLVDLAG
jgi:Mn2+/Fe2+ NRAMP family transporter